MLVIVSFPRPDPSLELNAYADVFILEVYHDSGPADNGDGHRMTSAIPSADGDGVATHLPSDGPTSSAPASLTRIQKRKLRYKLYRAAKRREEREMKLANNAMSDGPPTDSDPNRMTNDAPDVDEGASTCMSNHASTDPSSAVASSTPSNRGMKRRLSSGFPQAAKRKKEAANNATLDLNPNHTLSNAPGSDRDSAAACLSSHTSTLPSSTPSILEVAKNMIFDGPLTNSSDPNHIIINATGADNDGAAAGLSSHTPKPRLSRKQRGKLCSKIYRGAKRYKEKQMRLAKEAMTDGPLTESDQYDPNVMTNDAPGIDSGRAAACLSGDASIPPILRRKGEALHIGAGLRSAELNDDA